MASLNTLRTKFGFALTAIIALALLAFIFSMKDGLGFSSNEEPVVGSMNSEEITQREYNQKYNDIKVREDEIRRRQGYTTSIDQYPDQLSFATWNELYVENVLIPSYDELGLAVSDDEYLAAVAGEAYTDILFRQFGDPTSRAYSSQAASQVIAQSEQSEELANMWELIKNRARQERAMQKYNVLLQSSVFFNDLELAEGVEMANNTYSGKFISLPYSSIKDSEIEVTDAEIENYYNAYQAKYKQTPSRAIKYVSFDFDATADDILAIEKRAKEAAEKFESAEDIAAYTRTNPNATIPVTYLTAAQVDAEELETLSNGEMYGPLKRNNQWVASRLNSSVSAPETVGMRFIMLPQTMAPVADSLVTLAKGDADFAELAAANSYDQQSAQNGGDMGEVPFTSLPIELASAIASAKQNDIVKVDFNGNTFILDLYKLEGKADYYSVATLSYPVEASPATIEAIYSDAGDFLSEAAGSVEAFEAAAATRPSVVVSEAELAKGQRMINGIQNSREIARWAFRATPGSISEVFNTPSGYVVAMVSGVDDSEYRPLADVTAGIKQQLINDKKFEILATKFKGATIEEMADALEIEVQEFSDINGSALRAPGMLDSRVIGAIASSEANVLSAPVQGASQAYVVVSTDIETTEDQTIEAERLRLESAARERVGAEVYQAIYEMSDVDNNLDMFF